MVSVLKSGSGKSSDLALEVGTAIFAKNLVSRRNSLQYTQQKLSDLSGVKLRTIQNYEKGSRPKGDNTIALAKVLDCSLDWLLMDMGPEPEPPGTEKQIDKTEPLYNKVEAPGVGDRMVEYNAGMNLKDKLIRSQEKLITHLEKECNDLKTRLEAIEKKAV
ncbi:helix-turn-helix domain-containing protein [candidate division WOR-3 bacterium]|nr:helix-turn-helix domain-containing protein [candidate division WOR-3 bacterium]